MVNVLEPIAICRVQSWDIGATAPTKLEHILGAIWPSLTGTFASGRVHVVCVGPTDWLVLSATLDDAELLLTLEGAFGGSTFRAANVSSALARVNVSGSHARTLLAKLQEAKGDSRAAALTLDQLDNDFPGEMGGPVLTGRTAAGAASGPRGDGRGLRGRW